MNIPVPRFSTAFCLVAALASGHARAQDQATTLAAMMRDATDVAQVRVLARRDDAHHCTVTFQTVAAIAGTPPATFELTETAGAACGRALTGIAIGGGYVVFLGDGQRLAFATSRAIVALEPGLVQHLHELATAAADPDARLRVLAEALSAQSPRVRDDAALAFAVSAGVERAEPAIRARLRDAMNLAVDAGDVPTVRRLTAAAARCKDPSLVDMLLARLDTAATPDLRSALFVAATRTAPDLLAQRVQSIPDAVARARLSAQLLPAAHAHARPIEASIDVEPRFRSIDPTRRRR